jgi:predicted nucleic acid-binding protein
VIVDTGVLYAAMAPRDRHHAACAKLLRAARELLLPAPVLVELDYFLSQLTGSSRPFDEVLRRIENGIFTVLDLASPPSSPGTSRRSSCFRRAQARLDEQGLPPGLREPRAIRLHLVGTPRFCAS